MNSSAVQGDNEEISEIKILNNKKKMRNLYYIKKCYVQ